MTSSLVTSSWLCTFSDVTATLAVPYRSSKICRDWSPQLEKVQPKMGAYCMKWVIVGWFTVTEHRNPEEENFRGKVNNSLSVGSSMRQQSPLLTHD